ncbi:bifunctional diaminohydroxyphosphoribosylaminopyrimidine deaminase/5-amino-6-(5-phosphoribosylamino)uracil reductase RibD [Deinococcus sp. YIM 77859]|uniref:bifunctional diaminohydroxyphosphoribosylaminopyrimidine deaminase/5-amino-6-(5-phosphoribosylamino)uracil reductase RibD n=1 Tax=Deinococcus sp. YIM 77859 TaxID=1540221 RepID=UPI00054F59DE|nr:bifunctional diaminohydroxyphosphoribosylaminopyrimidine deaminase/5-amino-6-(5-phosphoribosylamino)uracil reductase RibD [Deinococcus sp. YIM 77859]
MREALALAAQALGRTAPNPPVGCVLVQSGQAVGRGFHPAAGQPHAEVFALREAGEQARGATAYVTLEPCAHHGRTPPCADALIRAGVARVVIAALDPHPLVAGQGRQKLLNAGIQVTTGVLEAEALRQQAGFRSRVTRGRPWTVLKYAMTLDGKVAAPNGHSRWVTGEAARARVHRWRNELDAIAVGSGTVLADDPALTTRGVPGGRDPRRVVFDRRGRVPATARALGPGSILVTGPQTSPDPYEARGVTVLPAADLLEALLGLGELGVNDLLLEGGPRLAGAFVEADAVDEVRVFVAPKLLGAGLPPLDRPPREAMHLARTLRDVTTEQLGTDTLIQGFLHDIPTLSPEAAAALLGRS